MTPRLLVIGGGAAGTAAAWCAVRSGIDVTLVHHLPGATELYSGAVMRGPSAPTLTMDDDVRGFVRALGLWSVEPRGHRVATGSGVVRVAHGVDHALLDLEPLAGLRIAVAEVDREHYDGKSLACALGASPWARETRTRFDPVRVDLLRREQERRYTHHDFAELHDSAERIEWLAERLGRASLSHDAWLLGPWLGLEPGAIAHLRLALLRPVGETTSLPGGAAGDRFRHARDQLLAEIGVRVVRARLCPPVPGGGDLEGRARGARGAHARGLRPDRGRRRARLRRHRARPAGIAGPSLPLVVLGPDRARSRW